MVNGGKVVSATANEGFLVLRCRVHLGATYNQPLKSSIVSQVKSLRLGLWTAVDDVKPCLSFVTWTFVGCCKAAVSVTGRAVTVVSLEAVCVGDMVR